MSSYSDLVPEYLPRSLLQHLKGGVDTDVVGESNLYFVKPSQQLVVGKYVPDEVTEEKDNANEGSDDIGDETPSSPVPAGCPSLDATHTVHFAVPKITGSSSPLYFPIHYPSITQKDKADPRGLPLAINKALHGTTDRPQVPKTTATVKSTNLNKVPLYKVGPGAVAFRVVLNAIEAGGMKYTPDNSLMNLLWAKRATPDILARLSQYQKINHFPGTWGVGRKDSLHKNISRMRRQFGEEAFSIVPRTWLIPSELGEVTRDCENARTEKGVDPTYIVKPSASSCGKGILLYQGVPPSQPGTKQMICQRYVANPMIIHGRKFDLRMYCVVTGFDPLRVYLFDQGLVRFAAEKYPGADKLLENSNAHLTNYSINKVSALAKQSKGKDVETDEAIDIKWAISDLKAWLEATYGPEKAAETWGLIYERAKDVVIKTFLSIESDVVAKIRGDCLSDPTGSRCFELYGLDLMVDADYGVTLIEVNIMPSLATGSTLDKAVKARMIAHMLTLAGVFSDARDASLAEDDPETDEPPLWFSLDKYYYPSCPGAASGPEGRNNIPLLKSFDDPAEPHSQLSGGERRMIAMVEEELARAGGFDRIFPTPTSFDRYAPYFSKGLLRSNYLMMSWEQIKAATKA